MDSKKMTVPAALVELSVSARKAFLPSSDIVVLHVSNLDFDLPSINNLAALWQLGTTDWFVATWHHRLV